MGGSRIPFGQNASLVRSISAPSFYLIWSGPGGNLGIRLNHEVSMNTTATPPLAAFTIVTALGNFMPTVVSWPSQAQMSLIVPGASMPSDPSPVYVMYTGDGAGYQSSAGLYMQPYAIGPQDVP